MKSKMKKTLAAALLALCGSAALAGPTTEVNYASLSGTLISFSELALADGDSQLIEGLFSSGGVMFGERFAGQELSIAKAPRPGAVAQDWFDDLSYGSPTSGLTLLAGAAGANLGAYNYGDANGVALAGIGPQNSDGSDPFGFGAVSARFAAPVSALGFQLRDSDYGGIWLSLYRTDGSLIETLNLSNRGDGFYAFTRSDGTADIAGFSLTNRDAYYGIALDNLVISAVPEPASALLLGCGVAALIARRRQHNQA
ncbi:PEP-CTERM sorting domain-containing protein [Burkholderiaceae bacterium UC74_6]